MIEVVINSKSPKVIKEQLERLGVGSYQKKTLFQTCHLIKIDEKFYIIHYKEWFGLRGDNINWKEGDIERRNTIIKILKIWNYIDIINPEEMLTHDNMIIEDKDVKVLRIRHEDKKNWVINKMIDLD